MLATDQINAANLRFASHYLSRLKNISSIIDVGGSLIADAIQHFDVDYPQIERVLAWLSAHHHIGNEVASIFLQILETGYNIFSRRLSSEKLLLIYQQGVQVAQYFNNPSMILLNQLAIANAYTVLNQNQEALEILQQSILIAEQNEDKVRLARCLAELSFVYSELDNGDESFITANQAMALYRELNDRQRESYCLYRLAQILRRKGEWDAANTYLMEAYQIAIQYDNQAHTHKILGLMGELLERQGHIDQAFEYKLQSLEIARQMGNLSDITFDLTSLGISCDIKSDFSQAQEYYRQALKIANKMGFVRQKIYLLGNLGYSAYVQKDYQTAVGYIQECLQMLRISRQEFMICVMLANLTAVHAALENIVEAHQAVYEGLELAHRLENKQLQVMMMVAAVQFYVSVALTRDGITQHEIMSHAVRWSGFIYSSSFSDQENRGELDNLRPRMEQVLDQETLSLLLSEGAQMELETIYQQILSLKHMGG